MAVTLNARGTSVSSFTIGKGGQTISLNANGYLTIDDGVDTEQPIGYNTIPIYEIDAADTFDLAHAGMMWHKDSGGAVTFTCDNDSTIPQGSTWIVHNDDAEDITIAEGTGVTIAFLASGAAPSTGDVTVSQGGIVTVYKYTDTEYWVWGDDGPFNILTAGSTTDATLRWNGSAWAENTTITATSTGVLTAASTAGNHTFSVDSATTNADIPVMKLSASSTGTPTAGIGPSIQFEAETAAANLEIGGEIALEATDVTATTEDFDFVFNLMAAGAAATEAARITSTGSLFLPEKADADADVAGYGQIWVNTATPNELYFTDDAGTDFLLNSSNVLPSGTTTDASLRWSGSAWVEEDRIRISDAGVFTIYDGTLTDSAAFSHNGTNFNTAFTTTTDWGISGLSNVNLSDGAGLRFYDGTNTDIARFSHDGTDFNTAFTTTTDWNIDGYSQSVIMNNGASGAATLRLLSDSNPYLGLGSGAGYVMGVTSSNTVQISSGSGTNAGINLIALGTSGRIDFQANGQRWAEVQADGTFRINASGQTDFADFDHDGTDFNTTFTNTVDWNISGLSNQVNILDAELTVEETGGGQSTLRLGGPTVRTSNSSDGRIIMFGENSSTKYGAEITIPAGYINFLGSTEGGATAITGARFNLSAVDIYTGGVFRVRDSSGVDHIAISHDGTDANIVGTTTTDLNITSGFTAVNLPEITLTTALDETYGGTGQTTYATGDVLYASGANTLSKLAIGSAGTFLRSNASTVEWSGVSFPNSATTGDIIYASATNNYDNLAGVATGNALISGGVGTAPSWGKIALTTHVSGVLPEANGGTNQSTYTTGDILYSDGANSLAKLALGNVGEVLTVVGSNVAWNPPAVIEFAYDSTVTAADPGAGTIRFDSVTIGSIANAYIDDLDASGDNAEWILSNLADGDILTFRSITDSADYIIASVNGTPTDGTGYWTVPLTLIHTGTIFTDTDQMRVSVEWAGSNASVSGFISGTVADNQIVTGTGASSVDSSANLTYDGTTLTMAGAGAQLLLPQENDNATPTLAFGDGDTGFYELSDDTLRLAIGTSALYQFDATHITGTTSASFYLRNTTVTDTNPSLGPRRDTNTGIGSAENDSMSLIAGGTEHMRFDATVGGQDHIKTEVPFYMDERAAALNDYANYGQLWVRNDAPNTLMYTNDAGNDFTANNVFEIAYVYSSAVTSTDPGAGTLNFDSVTIGSITTVYIDDVDDTGRDNSYMLSTLADGDLIEFRSASDPADYIVATVNGAPTDSTGFWTIGLTLVSTGTIFTNSDQIRIIPTFLSQAPGGGTVTSSGSPLNNEVAVFTSGTDIDSDSTFTWDGTTVTATNFSGNGSALTSLTAANISSGNLGSGVLPYATVDTAASAYKIPFLNTTGTASGNFGLLHDTTATFTYNPSTNTVTASNFAGNASTASQWATTRTINMTGDVTSDSVNIDGSGNITITNTVVGNDSHTHDANNLTGTTLNSGVVSSSLTSVGTLTALQVDNININLNTISSTAGTDLNITPLAGQQIVLDGTIVIDAGSMTGITTLGFDSVSLTAIQTSGEGFADNDTSIMTSAAIDDRILSYGYSTTTGTVTGTGTDNFIAVWNGTGDIDADSSFLITNAVDKSATETISGEWTFSGNPIIEQAVPRLYLRDTDATADEGNWFISGANDVFQISTASDAAPTSAVENAITINRAGTAVSNVTINNGDLVLNENLSFDAVTNTIAGIQNQNLVDKTAAESISGTWTHTVGIVITDTTEALALRAGDTSAVFAGDQITFGFDGNNDYQHAIGTRHNSAADVNNAIDFYLWDFGTDTQTTVGTFRALTLDQTGSSFFTDLDISGALTLGTALDEAEGGTGQTTYATGDILYASASNVLSKLAAGTDTHVLTLSSGVPTWAAAPGATPPTTITVANEATDTTCFPLFVTAATGDLGPKTNANLTFNSNTGHFTATSKSFLIDHPTKPNKKLQYGSLEGPEHGVYVRGRLTGNDTIELPDYWTALIDPNSITVNLTPIGAHQELYVADISDNKVIVGGSTDHMDFFYTVYAERVDVDKIELEIDKEDV